MSASLQPDVSSDAAASSQPVCCARIGFWLVSALVAGWILVLSLLTFWTANPPVLNRVQLTQSDAVFVGRWVDEATGRFEVTQELKHGQPVGIITVSRVPKLRMHASDRWVIPVTKLGDVYSVTQGTFVARVFDPQTNGEGYVKIQVVAQCYPATDEVLAQVQTILEQSAQ